MVLYHYNRPCVNLATYALATLGIAPYQVCFNQIVKNPWDGCAKSLQGEQLPIKCAWLALHSWPIKGTYDTDVTSWLCSCGAQKYHSYLLCKHLVQKLLLPSPDWWPNVIRRHTPPFYDILDLLSEEQQKVTPILLLWAHNIGSDGILLHCSIPCLLLCHRIW